MLKIVMILSLVSLFVALSCAAPAGNKAPNIFSSGDEDEADEDDEKPVQESQGQSPSMHPSEPAPNMQRAPVQQDRPNGIVKDLGGNNRVQESHRKSPSMHQSGPAPNMQRASVQQGRQNGFNRAPGGLVNPLAGMTSFLSGLGIPVLNLPGMSNNGQQFGANPFAFLGGMIPSNNNGQQFGGNPFAFLGGLVPSNNNAKPSPMVSSNNEDEE